jgi:hypothetical protein
MPPYRADTIFFFIDRTLSVHCQYHAMGLIQYVLTNRTRSVHCQYMPRHILGYGADTIFSYGPDSIYTLSIYAQVICHAMGPIQYFSMYRTRSVHCQYMHKSYAVIWR